MSFHRLAHVLLAPFNVVYAKLRPVEFARKIGVRMAGRVHIYGSSYAMFSSEPFLVSLGDNVHISNDVRFICHDGGVLPLRALYPDLEIAAEIAVGDNVFIGYGTTVLAGVTIGSDCIIGACSLVTKDVPSGSVYAGNPARFIKTTADYLRDAQAKSLRFGHLTGPEKVAAYKRQFAVD